MEGVKMKPKQAKPKTRPTACVIAGTPPAAVAVFSGRKLTAVAYLEPA